MLFIITRQHFFSLELTATVVVLGGLGVTCLLRDPSFAGSNPTDVYGCFRMPKSWVLTGTLKKYTYENILIQPITVQVVPKILAYGQ